MTCLEARRLTPRFVALELPQADERLLREHLAVCGACRDAVAQREPALSFAWAMAAATGPEDDSFAAEVMTQIHQRRLERRLGGRKSRVLAAAAIVLTLLGGATVARRLARPALSVVARASAPARHIGTAAAEPSFVEVDNAGVRLYQLAPASQSRTAIQVAFIVDPHLEL